MAMTKTTPEVAVAARLFHGLSDPTRMSVLLRLLDGERRVTDLVADVGGSQSNISAHLACLKDCGLVTDRPGERRQVFYRIAHEELRDLLRATEALLGAAGNDIDLCRNPLMGR
jgi:ArsR family transcriptional regulator, cadmium/lead-responsive transcriptional repressor